MKFVGTALLVVCLSNVLHVSSAVAKSTPVKDAIAPVIQGDAAAGKIKSDDNRCQECHGADGNGQGSAAGSLGKFAKLSGQYPDYMMKQIREFRSGVRKHDFMLMMAKSIDDTDAADIAAYFSSQTKMHGDGSGKNDIAKNLFTNGDASRNILACASCHGADGKGIDATQQTIPVIGGQEWRYLEKQLQDWRSGERHNSAANVMNTVTKSLTDAEVQALTDYISGL